MTSTNFTNVLMISVDNLVDRVPKQLEKIVSTKEHELLKKLNTQFNGSNSIFYSKDLKTYGIGYPQNSSVINNSVSYDLLDTESKNLFMFIRDYKQFQTIKKLLYSNISSLSTYLKNEYPNMSQNTLDALKNRLFKNESKTDCFIENLIDVFNSLGFLLNQTENNIKTLKQLVFKLNLLT